MSGETEFEFLDPFGSEAWDLDNSGFMQSRLWAAFKSGSGWTARVCRPRDGGEGSCVLILRRPLRAGLSFAYVPFGPERLPEGEEASVYLKALAGAIARDSGRGLLFVRFDLPCEKIGSDRAAGGRFGKLARGSSVQVPDTVLLDLGPGLDAVLAGMKPKWRYNIRLAEKKGVVVSREGPESLDTFHALYRETASRDGIAIHPLSYYRDLFHAFEANASSGPDRGDLSLWVAREAGQAIAAIITLFHRRHATYLYGASSGEKRSLMPAYALQWSAIQAASDSGCVDYDFFGIPPDEDPSHPMAGLYLFKTGFGGRIVHRVGAIDIPFNVPAYFAFRVLESARLAWYKGLKKTLARIRRPGNQRKTDPAKA